MSVHKNHRLLPQPIALAGQPRARGWYIAAALLLLISASALFGATPVAQAASITVTGAEDVVADDGVCALREAITAADTDTPSGAAPGECPAGTGPDTIILAAGATYTLTTGQLLVDSAITIQGNGAMVERSSAEGTPRFRVFSVVASGNLTLENLTVINGLTGAANGGGIENFGILVLTDSAISGNTSGQTGGGIQNRTSGTLTLTNSTVSGNTASAEGGGIFNGGTLTLTDSTISGNTASDGGGGLFNGGTLTLTGSTVSGNEAHSGGGIYNNNGMLDVTNSAVSGNYARSNGGGIFNGGTLTLTGSTISGNSASGPGGGILNGGAVTLVNSTISGNFSAFNGGGMATFGGSATLVSSTVVSNSVTPVLQQSTGGIYVQGPVTLVSTIIAQNYAQGVRPSDCRLEETAGGSIDSRGHNMDSDGTCHLDGPGDMPLTTPHLGRLQDNGGPTQTHALLSGSPAIDAIPVESCVDAEGNPIAADQRGVPRPQGAACDIGAVEARPVITGDLNCDGALNILDVVLLLQRIVGLVSQIQPCAA